jgi:uncharacterized membrane protein
MNSQPQNTHESILFRACCYGLLFCTATGIILLLSESRTVFLQFSTLFHMIVGSFLTAALLIYLVVHTYRSIRMRKPALLISGALLFLVVILYFGSALFLAVVGRREDDSFLILAHGYGGFFLIALLAGHILFNYSKKYSRSRLPTGEHLIDWRLIRRCGSFLALSFAAIGAFTLIYTGIDEDPVQLVEDYRYPYGEHPFRPSQTETASGSFVHPKKIGNSADCASCHREIAEQWRSSIHGRAADDPTYVTNVSLLADDKGIEATRYCEGCHAPVALLTGDLTEGGQHGGIDGTLANREGVSCVSCHRTTEVVHLDGVASYLFTPAKGYLFEYSDNKVLGAINNYLTRVSSSLHKSEMSSAVLAQPTQCATCHAQFMDKSMNNWGWVKMQDEYSAWLKSPYSQQHQQQFAEGKMVRCQDCHMPLVAAKDPSANSEGKVRSHRFLGANTMAPYIRGDTEHLELTKQFLQSNKMRISIEKPHRTDAIQSRLTLEESLRGHRETPHYKYLGETVALNVVVSNVGVGHDFPGGTTDINEAWVELKIKDATGQLVYASGTLDEEGYLDQSSHIYQSIPVDKNGNHVWKHDLFNRIGETYKNVVKAGESDIVQYNFEVPKWAKGPLVATVTLKYRKLNTRYAKWALKDQYRPLPIVDMAHHSLLIDILDQPSLRVSVD